MQEGCTTPIAAYATLNDGKLTLQVQYFDPIDFIPLETTVHGAAHEAVELGIQAAGHIKGLLSDVQ
jgi:porphobilinogen deaminase